MEESEADQLDMICQACITQHPFLVNYDGETSHDIQYLI